MLGQYYRILLFADFIEEIDHYDYIDTSVFVLSTMMIVVIFMNLLISIIGDSHERVYTTIKNTEGLIKCQFIFELEVLIVWPWMIKAFGRKLIAEEGYIIFGQYVEKTDGNEWQGRVNQIVSAVGKRIDKMENNLGKNNTPSVNKGDDA